MKRRRALNQEELKNRINKYIAKNGISAKWIANHCNIPDYTLSKFRNSKIEELYQKSAEALDKFLVEHNA